MPDPTPPPGARCPACGCRDLRKSSPDGRAGYCRDIPGGRRRIRYCRHCGRRVVTVEVVQG